MDSEGSLYCFLCNTVLINHVCSSFAITYHLTTIPTTQLRMHQKAPPQQGRMQAPILQHQQASFKSYYHIYSCGCAGACQACLSRSEDSLRELVLSFQHVFPGTELRLPGLLANFFTGKTISLAAMHLLLNQRQIINQQCQEHLSLHYATVRKQQ